MNKDRQNLGAIPSEFIRPGVDKECPGTGLHVKATPKEIHIYPERKSQRRWWVKAQITDDGSMSADVKTKGRRSGKYKLDIRAGNFIRFAFDYFTHNAKTPPSEFIGFWLPRKSVNFTQFRHAMRGKANSPENRRNAASQTWTAEVLKDMFEVDSASRDSTGRYISVRFTKK